MFEASNVSKMNTKLYQAITEIKLNLQHFKKPFQLILIPILFHTGLNFAFVAGEITRAYVACVFSITEVSF